MAQVLLVSSSLAIASLPAGVLRPSPQDRVSGFPSLQPSGTISKDLTIPSFNSDLITQKGTS